jgi:hypothetical protein
MGTNISVEHTASIFTCTVTMEAVCPSGTVVPTYQTARCRNPEVYYKSIKITYVYIEQK